MNQSVVNTLIQKLGPEKVLTGAAVMDSYYHIWRMDHPLEAVAMVLPESTADVSEIMKICYEHHQPVIVYGGRTGMVGGTETEASELIISLEKMNTIEEVDTSSRTMTVQAGVILEHVQQAATEQNLLFPLNFGAKGSAHIGGAISTNAGGLRVLRYGMTRQLVLGVEAVMADGTIISAMKKIIKDNSAYDVKHLFIGSEGTLGIVTRAVLKLVEAPRSRCSACAAFDDYNKVVAFLKFMDSSLAGTLSSFELMWKDAYIALTSPPATSTPPLPYDYPYYVLVESLGSDQEKDQEHMMSLLEEALERGMVLDAVPAQSGSEVAYFWKIREDVDNMVARCKHDHHFDISLPIPHIGPYVEKVVAELHEIPQVEQVYAFGHVADGNIHLVLGKGSLDEALTHQINEVVYTGLPAVGGSVSAEHGIGVHKKPYLHLSRSEAEIQLMRKLKQAMDPLKLLNRGKVVD